MIVPRWFWFAFPICVVISGNFSPLRVGPILPIFLLLVILACLSAKAVLNLFLSSAVIRVSAFVLVLFLIYRSFTILNENSVDLIQFEQAINPEVYSLLSIGRYLLGLFVISIFRNSDFCVDLKVTKLIFATYFALTIPLFSQALAFFYSLEFGYLFFNATGVRFGGLFGEPQTVSAWICCLYITLNALPQYIKRAHRAILTCTLIGALILTQSTAWILAMAFYFFTQSNKKILVLLLTFASGLLFGDQMIEKVFAELFTISERSVTVVAGWEVFSGEMSNWVLGYGVGLTPFVIPGAEIFFYFPDLDLSGLGRQTVMNSFLEVIFEFGVVGSFLYLFLLSRALCVSNLRQFLAVFPLFIGIFGVGGGLVSGYFLIFAPLIVLLKDRREGFGQRVTMRWTPLHNRRVNAGGGS